MSTWVRAIVAEAVKAGVVQAAVSVGTGLGVTIGKRLASHLERRRAKPDRRRKG